MEKINKSVDSGGVLDTSGALNQSERDSVNEYAPVVPEASAEVLERIRETITSRIEATGKKAIEAERAFGDARSRLESTEPEDEERYEILEPIFGEILQKSQEARKRFWTKFRIASSALLVFFATPDRDSPHPLHPGNGTFSERSEAAKQLKENGITDYQRQAYFGQLSDVLERGLRPFGYSSTDGNSGADDIERGVGSIIDGIFTNSNEKWETGEIDEMEGVSRNSQLGEMMVHENRNRMDAWRLYLGIPQKNGTFGISDYKPSTSKEDKFYYSIHDFLGNVKQTMETMSSIKNESPMRALVVLADMDLSHGSKTTEERLLRPIIEEGMAAGVSTAKYDLITGVMGTFTLKKGHDEHGDYISYYDLWDLGGSIEGKDGMIGKPFEIYDRIYYDPVTFEVLHPHTDVPVTHSS